MNKKGFTLVEILAVIVILSLIITIVATVGFGVFDNTKEKITEENRAAIREAANILMVEIRDCDEKLDSELINTFVANDLNGDTKKDCKDLKKQSMPDEEGGDECLNVSLQFLIDKKYITGSGVNDILKNDPHYSVNICINFDEEEVMVDFPEEEGSPIGGGNGGSSTSSNCDNLYENDTLACRIYQNAINARDENSSTKTIFAGEKAIPYHTSLSDERIFSSISDNYSYSGGIASYYFRGNVIDNYVDFAGMCWKIVRIAGNKTIKIILVDKNNSCNAIDNNGNVNTTDAFIGLGNYGYEEVNGYDLYATYGKINGFETSDTIKYKLKVWVNSNIGSYIEYLSNDNEHICIDSSKSLVESNDGHGHIYGYNYSTYNSINNNSYIYSLGCTSDDIYSLAEDEYAFLLTASEAFAAGVAGKFVYTSPNTELYSQQTTYLKENALGEWMLMTPKVRQNTYDASGQWPALRDVIYTLDSDKISQSDWVSGADINIRPVISLKEDVKYCSGDGTVENAYKINDGITCF